MHNVVENIILLKKGLNLIKSIYPGYIVTGIIEAVFIALYPFINIYMSAIIMNAIEEKKSFQVLFSLVILMLILNLLCSFIKSFIGKMVTLKEKCFFSKYNWLLNKKIMELDYIDIENFATQEIKESIHQMQNVNGLGITELILSSKTLVQNFFTIIFSISIVASLFIGEFIPQIDQPIFKFVCSPWVAVILGIIVIMNIVISLVCVSKSTKKIFNTFSSIVPQNRLFSYYIENYVESYHSGKDIRLYKQAELIDYETTNIINGLKPSLVKLKSIEFNYSSIATISTSFVNICIYIYVGIKALAGAINIGGIVQYIGGINQFVTGFTNLVRQLTRLKENNEALKIVLDYLNRNPSMYSGNRKIDLLENKPLQIEFKNVSFKYPMTSINVIKNVSLKIDSGEKIAIVGMNGSGKTTLIKLLNRLYDPQVGEIRLNGVNIKEYNTENYQKLFSVVYQDFKLFSFSLGENIAGSRHINTEKAYQVLKEVGFENKLKEMNLDTRLYKDFDENGFEISGGEAQKIAIARSLYRSSPFLIFDEPTAALDPLSEYEIYKQINDISSDKTIIFISHRMSSCKFSDRILVFDQGELVQMGNHESLLKDKKGKYYQLWNAQAQYYK